MSKIPTAEESLKKNIDYVLEKNVKEDVVEAIIKLIKLHLQAQQEAILKKVSLTDFAQEFLQERVSDAIDKESIINAYPLENIK